MPGLFRAGLAASRLLQAITGPAAGRAGQLSTSFPRRASRTISTRSPFYNGGALPALVLPLACLLPGSVEIDRGFSPPSNPDMPGLLLVWVAGHSLPPPGSAWSAVTYPTQKVAYRQPS